ncbi:MAG: hypothetical protein EZS28_002183 [Streblomastix strix]|uniref:Uncharacterized protein n=1 Tax=Streblomastix strix TaxID=222440 RepID=A0A5J4X522_9EUKA|nr:MAG: hypothetical protein EZS28_002183 [Streblomastix strix]
MEILVHLTAKATYRNMDKMVNERLINVLSNLLDSPKIPVKEQCISALLNISKAGHQKSKAQTSFDIILLLYLQMGESSSFKNTFQLPSE